MIHTQIPLASQFSALQTAATERLQQLLQILQQQFLPHSDSEDCWETVPSERSRELTEILHVINSLATRRGCEALLEAFPQLNPPWYAFTPADIAIAAWIENRDLCERVFLEQQQTQRSRTFSVFHAFDLQSARFQWNENALGQLQFTIDQALQAHGRGPGTQLSVSQHGEEYWFLIRHGELWKRQPCVEEGRSHTLLFRPEACDLLILNPQRGELRMNRMHSWQSELYRTQLGQQLFGRGDLFRRAHCYTLQPLRAGGGQSLCCADVPQLLSVRLNMLRFCEPGKGGHETQWSGTDLSDTHHSLLMELPHGACLLEARFQIRIVGARGWRSVTLKPPNQLRCSLDSDRGVVEEWLTKRGFVGGEQDGHDESTVENGSILAFPGVPARTDHNPGRMATLFGT